MISSALCDLSIASIAFFEIFMVIRMIGMMTGKDNMAMSSPLSCALEAILDIKVKQIENPTAAKDAAAKNMRLSSTGLPKTIANEIKETKAKTNMKATLKMIFEIIRR